MTSNELQECPFYLITRASLAITARLRRELTAAGLGIVRTSYLVVLMTLWHEDGLKAVEVGRRAGLEPSTMTGLLDRMERDGLLMRRPDPDDRRAQRIFLSDTGSRMEGVANDVVDLTLAQVMNGLDSSETEHMKSALGIILRNLDRGPQRQERRPRHEP